MKLVPSYQEGDLVARQDNTRVAKSPTVKPVKQRITPKPQPQFIQDNRSKWQRKQDSDRGDKEYNNYMEAKKTERALQTLNAFLEFTDYAAIATGAGGLAGKGLRYAGKNLMKRNMKNAIKRTLTNEERLGIPRGDRKSPSPYKQVGTAVEPKSRMEDLTVDSPIFGDYINRGSSQFVFNNSNNPNEVLKVYTGRNFKSPPEIKEFHRQWMKRNKLPLQERINFKGYLQLTRRQ